SERQQHGRLKWADVVAGEAHAGLLSTARRASAGERSARGRVSNAIDRMPAHTSVAIATWRPLKNAAPLTAAPAPTATCRAKTASVATATGRNPSGRTAGTSRQTRSAPT